MRTIIMSILSVLLMVVPMYGQGFNPNSPEEPGVPPVAVYIYTFPANGGSVSGSGKYVPGAEVSIRAWPNSNYTFVNWTDSEGTIVSTSRDYTFIKGVNPELFTANFTYSPGSPAEPEPGVSQVYYTLTLATEGSGTVSGGGRYQAGSSIRLYASPSTNNDFVYWTNESNEVVSTSATFYYTSQAFNETLTAHFVYNPSSPAEPSEPVLSHTVTLIASSGGTCNTSSIRNLTGERVYISAYPNSGYRFGGWFMDGKMYSDQSSLYYTIGNTNVFLEARFIFDPASPGEPIAAARDLSFYLMSEITYPGTKVEIPVFVTTGQTLTDMTFQLSFPPEALPDWSTVRMLGAASGYKLSVIENTGEEATYMLNLVGSEISPGVHPLLTVLVDVPEDVECGKSFPVKINQVSVTLPSGATMTTTTRNGRVYVYELGDNNGDGVVDFLDYVNMTLFVVSDGRENEVFINEVSDANEDGNSDFLDAVRILEIILYK